MEKMKVEIWSDIMCPFCYIGKRKFETALQAFDNKEAIEIEWKSFQLSPDMKTEPGKNIHQYLSEHKGISLEKAKQLNEHVTAIAKQVGLEYNFDISVLANSFDAHRFLHHAKKNGKQNEAEELLFAAYFTEGKNISDYSTLLDIAHTLGLEIAETKGALENNEFSNEVNKDVFEAQQIGVSGVPFFVFDRKYAVSGAQESNVFLGALKQSYQEWKK